MRGTTCVGRIALACVVTVWAQPGGAQGSGPGEPSPTPTPGASKKVAPTPGLLGAVERHVEKLLQQEELAELPRFKTSIEVVGDRPQVMLERFFRGFDLECGPASGAPTEAELRAVRPHVSPGVDFVALASFLRDKLSHRGGGAAHYFLYRVMRPDGSPARYSLRDARLPESWPSSLPGTTFELLETFPDLKTATAAWRRLERGLDNPTSQVQSSRIPAWSTANCRPR